MPEPFEVFALRLASVDRLARDNFHVPGDREGTMALDFTMWVIRNAERVIAVDTGFSEWSGQKRNRTLLSRPAAAVRRLGIEPEDVGHVVITHLHYDHAGNVEDFPEAQVIVQSKEIEYATGRAMTRPQLNHFFEIEDIVNVVRRVHASRIRLIDGFCELAPGLELHLVGGHTKGLQVVRTFTERGWIVLASDAVHYYDNLAERNPFPAFVDLAEMLDGYDTILALADSPDHVIPGHDPAVFERYSDLGSGEPEVAILHRPPRAVVGV